MAEGDRLARLVLGTGRGEVDRAHVPAHAPAPYMNPFQVDATVGYARVFVEPYRDPRSFTDLNRAVCGVEDFPTAPRSAKARGKNPSGSASGLAKVATKTVCGPPTRGETLKWYFAAATELAKASSNATNAISALLLMRAR